MQGFVGGINHHKSKRLYKKCASSPNFMCLAKWFNVVFNDNFAKFCKWNKGLLQRRCFRNLFRIYLLILKALKSVFLCILLNENYRLKLLMENKFIYRVMHAYIEFKLKIFDKKKSFPCFFDNPNWSVRPSWLHPPQTVESTQKRVWNFLNFKLKLNRNGREIFAVEKNGKTLYADLLLVRFIL